MTKLFLFDLDGTLVKGFTSDLRYGVKRWFAAQQNVDCWFGLCANCGGVGLRHWMTKGRFGDPTQYPSEEKERQRVADTVGQLGVPMLVYLCFAYQSKRTGEWAPTPFGKDDCPEWMQVNRKPQPGMLLMACAGAKVAPWDALMIGNSEEDSGAARAIEMPYVEADEFFKTDPRVWR